MIRYSAYGSSNYRTRLSLPDPDPLKTAYCELLELRERVRRAEAIAARQPKTTSRRGATATVPVSGASLGPFLR